MTAGAVAIVVCVLAAAIAGFVFGRTWHRTEAPALPSGRERAATPPTRAGAGASAAPTGGDGTPGTGISAPVGAAPTVWSAVLDTLPLGVVVMAADGSIRFRNAESIAAAATHTGLLIDNAVRNALQQALRGAETEETVEFYGPPKVTVVVRAQPIYNGAAVATVEDISERRRVDAVRTDFVANISHELKTPIGALAVLADAIADEDDPAVVKRVADRMVSESDRVSRTIDDLMELSRIELGEEPVRDLVSIDEVVKESVERANTFAESRRIGLAVLDGADDLWVIGDRRQLISALGNLVENGIKYSESGGSVQLRVRAVEGVVELMVVDTGIGIPASEHDRIFERFYRVDRARSRDTGGTGLGLSIVRHIATNHHGEVLVASDEGEGSTFVLRLPRAYSGQPLRVHDGGTGINR